MTNDKIKIVGEHNLSSNDTRDWMIDDIVIGTFAKSWLKNRHLLPSAWGLDANKVERIQNANVRVTIMCSPASEVPLTPNPLKHLDAVNLVMVDANTFSKQDGNKNYIFTREQIIAAILHEIGHAVHDMKPQKSRIDALKADDYVAHMNRKDAAEKAADDFAREMGFGNQVATGLKTLVRIMPDKFDNEGVRERIKRIEEENIV